MMAMTIAPFFKRESVARSGRRTMSTTSAPFDRVGRHRGAGGRIVGIEDARLHARARLDGDFRAEPDHFLDGFRGRGDPRLVRVRLGNNRNLHEFLRGLAMRDRLRGRYGLAAAVDRDRPMRPAQLRSGNRPSG